MRMHVAETEMTTVVLIAAAHAERHYVVTTLEQPHNSCCKNFKHVTRSWSGCTKNGKQCRSCIAEAACLDVEGLFTVTVRHDVAAYHQHAAVAIL